MLRSFQLCCCFLLLGIAGNTQNLPSIEDVAGHFFTTYDAPHELWRLHFEKRPEGYYVAYREKPHAIKNRYLIYSNGSYHPINSFPSASTQSPQAQTNYKDYVNSVGRYLIDEYERYPFFGYNGWYQDVIEQLEQQDKLTNDELHILSRAYSTAALALIPDYKMYSIKEEEFDLPTATPNFTTEQQQLFLERAEKAINSYGALLQRDSTYMTPVGPIRTKWSNEYLSTFMILQQHTNETIAKSILIEGLYDEYLLMQARNYLRSCPANSVLLTYGDTDTYPLLYIQAMDGYRTDVIVANTSVLETRSYRRYITNGPFGAPALVNNFPELPQHNKINSYWLQTAGAQIDGISSEEFRQIILEEIDTKTYASKMPHALPKSTVLIPPPTNTNHALAGKELETIIWEPFSGSSYLSAGQLFLWNIIAAHQWERPLCFMPTNRNTVYKRWEPYLAYNGLVYQVYPHYFTNNGHPYIRGFSPSTYSYWMEDMSFDTTSPITSFDRAPFYQIQILEAQTLLEHLIAEDKLTEADSLLELLPIQFPNEISPWNMLWISIAEKAKLIGNDAIKNLLSNTIRQNLQAGKLENLSSDAKVWLENKLEILDK